jgi:hypothetical protein
MSRCGTNFPGVYQPYAVVLPCCAYFRLISRRGKPVFFFPLLNTVPFQDALYDLGGSITQTTEYAFGTIAQHWPLNAAHSQ